MVQLAVKMAMPYAKKAAASLAKNKISEKEYKKAVKYLQKYSELKKISPEAVGKKIKKAALEEAKRVVNNNFRRSNYLYQKIEIPYQKSYIGEKYARIYENIDPKKPRAKFSAAEKEAINYFERQNVEATQQMAILKEYLDTLQINFDGYSDFVHNFYAIFQKDGDKNLEKILEYAEYYDNYGTSDYNPILASNLRYYYQQMEANYESSPRFKK